MASDVDTLLHDALVLMRRLLELPQLPDDTREALRGLVARLQQADGHRPSYLDMKSARGQPLTGLEATLLQRPGTADHTDSADKWRWRTSVSSSRSQGGDNGDQDTSADCSECLDDSVDDWPPRGAPTCPRPDLSPDWAVSAAAARGRALHCGAVLRGGPGRGPGRWFRLRRRGWAALLPGPARLLVFSGPRSSRPRLVLSLASAAAHDAGLEDGGVLPCGDPCCAVYTARARPEGPAFELCCPGRKTHEIWVSDDEEAGAWVKALRRASQSRPPSPPTRATSAPVPESPTRGAPVVDVVGADGVATPDASLGTVAGSRSRSESRSASVLSDQRRASAECQAPASTATSESEQLPPAPPLTPPPPQGHPEDHHQQYESMLSAGEEIYHDIAPPEPESAGPSYANVGPTPSPPTATSAAELAADLNDGDLDGHARPLYDDVAVPAKPLYCNLQPGKQLEEDGDGGDAGEGEGEHLYDDIGLGGLRPPEARASVYELIQDPADGQGWTGTPKASATSRAKSKSTIIQDLEGFSRTVAPFV